MNSKKLVSLIMAVAMLITAFVIPSAFSAENVDIADTSVNTAADYDLTNDIQTGNILHAFNWRMSDLVKYAPEIAAAGYSTVQISPIQKTKVTANDGSYATDWWSFYQPTDFTIGNALGTEAELKEAVSTLHSYGIKVIADVVTNHLQNNEDKKDFSNISETVKAFLRNPYSHTSNTYIDSNRVGQTTTDMGKLKDLDTENKAYQNYVITNLLTPLIKDGVDGFRFDAAKHIATPDDNGCASDYWPTVTNAIRKLDSDSYIYGEVLNLYGQGNITGYTKYMDVTDYAYGKTVQNALSNKDASKLVDYGWDNTSKNQNVLWFESHDNFCDETSTDIPKNQQILGWAIVGCRADAPALFFVRPKHEALDSANFIKYDELMGAPGASDTWKNPTVVAINKFKNAFAGQSETDDFDGHVFFVQRGNTGMVIVNLDGKSTSINQTCSMKDGAYYDHVTGAKFTVSGGKISGTVGSTGVAVVYPVTTANIIPEISLSLNGKDMTPETLNSYTGATAELNVDLKNAESGTVKVGNLSAVTIDNGTTYVKLNSEIPYGKSVTVKITAKNGSKTISRTYTVKKKDPNEKKRVYFDNSVMKWPEIYVYCKTGTSPSTEIAKYDAYKLKPVSSGSNIYYYDVPANTKYVKFNEGYIGPEYSDKAHTDDYGRCHLYHTFSDCGGYCGRTMPETVVNYGTANEKSNREKGGYLLTGSMILTNLRFEDYGDYPAASLNASDVTVSKEPEKPTQPVNPGGKITRGDADGDGEVSILDATTIQRVLASLPVERYVAQAADTDKDNEISILDATEIQRYLAGMGNPNGIGAVIGGTVVTPDPTEAPTDELTQAPTEAPTITTQPLPNDFVAVIYCEDSGTDDTSRNKEAKFNKSTGTLVYEFVGPSYVFVRNYDTGVQYCTNGWQGKVNPATLVNQANLTAQFDKMYVPKGTNTLYLKYDSKTDTCTLGYVKGELSVEPGLTPTSGGNDPTTAPVTKDLTFIPGEVANDGAALFAWVWNDGSGGQWIAGKASGNNIVFPNAANYGNILIARMPSGTTTPDWAKCINQSVDKKVQAGKTLVFKSWGANNGSKFNIDWQ